MERQWMSCVAEQQQNWNESSMFEKRKITFENLSIFALYSETHT